MSDEACDAPCIVLSDLVCSNQLTSPVPRAGYVRVCLCRREESQETRPSFRMMTPTKPQSFVKLFCVCIISSVLVTVTSVTAEDWCTCAPIDGRCPPGFLPSDNGNSCVCGSEHDALPIHKCDERRCRAYLRSGYWAGYLKEAALN